MEPAVCFKKKAVEEHANSQQHSAAITAELLSRVSTFNEEIERNEKTRDEVGLLQHIPCDVLARKGGNCE